MALRAALRASAGTRPVELTRLTLVDFRSYASAELTPEPGLTVVAAPNGTGKTNLLEAIHVAITGRSHRAAVDADLVRHGAGFGRVRVEVGGGTAAGGATIELVLPGLEPEPGIRKRLTVNGVPRRSSTVADTARAVLFRPEEMLLLVGSPSDRRRFLDGILAQRDRRAARDLVEVARVLAQRNALLRAIRAEEAPIDSLGFWDEQLALVGARVMRARLEVVRELGARIGPLHDAVAAPAERGASVHLAYVDGLKEAWTDRADPAEGLPSDEELAAAYRRRITDVRQREAWNGMSLVGPQRDDLRAELGGRDVAAHASRGQQRTIILAMKLAETDLLGADGPRPIVLLDDVFSELDPERSARLSTLLADRGQVIVTTADPSTLDAARRERAAVWRIVNGQLVRET
ncbi:MAG TPA: DNA replication/repair protein RecF [Candidatus Limnocylindria bacterium]|nr:DNA replication/repair protein RecF [Candidatus Limnocylindria bacterium]